MDEIRDHRLSIPDRNDFRNVLAFDYPERSPLVIGSDLTLDIGQDRCREHHGEIGRRVANGKSVNKLA